MDGGEFWWLRKKSKREERRKEGQWGSQTRVFRGVAYLLR